MGRRVIFHFQEDKKEIRCLKKEQECIGLILISGGLIPRRSAAVKKGGKR
jgi:hypothetical protein